MPGKRRPGSTAGGSFNRSSSTAKTWQTLRSRLSQPTWPAWSWSTNQELKSLTRTAQQCGEDVAEPAGDLARTIAGICRYDVEGCPIDALERQRGVAQLAAEPRTDHFTALSRKSLTRTGISASSSRRRPGAASRQSRPSSQSPGRKPTREQAQLGAGEDHDLGSQPAEPLGPFGTVAKEIQQLLGGQVTGERRQPDLQADLGGVLRGTSNRSGSPLVTRTAFQ
jgi:hypothetical protein